MTGMTSAPRPPSLHNSAQGTVGTVTIARQGGRALPGVNPRTAQLSQPTTRSQSIVSDPLLRANPQTVQQEEGKVVEGRGTRSKTGEPGRLNGETIVDAVTQKKKYVCRVRTQLSIPSLYLHQP